jgi:FAD:protein FMN transferase
VTSRRRALVLLAAAAGLPLAGSTRGKGAPLVEWRGRALGAEARLLLVHPEPAAARRLIGRCMAEVARLERIFSLHDPDSELCRLNRDGRLAPASHDLRVVVAEAQRLGALSGGAFDPTIQPLWRLYADHFARPDAGGGPPAAAVEAALRRVDYRALDLDGTQVAFLRPGMAATLNGIAQGWITDRVADLLREAGLASVLVQLGETFAGDPPAGEGPWRVGVPDPQAPERMIETIESVNLAIATSSGQATRFDAAGRHHHLLDPRTGESARHHGSVTVVAARALLADGLSTALAVLPRAAAPGLLRASGAEAAFYLGGDGRRTWLNSPRER